jgi:hypothetical protein
MEQNSLEEVKSSIAIKINLVRIEEFQGKTKFINRKPWKIKLKIIITKVSIIYRGICN